MSIYAVAPGDRNVSWLAQCSRGWRFKPIKYLCALNSRVLSESTSADTEIKYIDISSVNSDGTWVASEPMTFLEAPSRARRILTDGDVLISTVRTYLRAIAHVGKVNEFLICSTGFAVLSAGKTVDSRFMAYWVRSKFFVDEVVSRSFGVSYPAINASDIGNLPLPVLPLSEQCSIAAFLDRMTSKIDALNTKKQRLIELLQEKRAALISHAVTKGLDPKVPMKDSGVEWLGKVPEHWQIMRLKWIFKTLNGSTPKSSEPNYWDGEIPWATPDDLGSLREDTLIETRRSITDAGYNSCGTSIAPIGSIILSTRAPIGYLAIAGKAMCANQGCKILSFKNNDNRRFFYYQLIAARPELESFGQGSTFKELAGSKLNCIPLVLPPLDEQHSISAFLDRETMKIEALISKIRLAVDKLKEYRTALISSAVTGKIDVPREVA